MGQGKGGPLGSTSSPALPSNSHMKKALTTRLEVSTAHTVLEKGVLHVLLSTRAGRIVNCSLRAAPRRAHKCRRTNAGAQNAAAAGGCTRRQHIAAAEASSSQDERLRHGPAASSGSRAQRAGQARQRREANETGRNTGVVVTTA